MSYRKITVDEKDYQYQIGNSIIVIRDGVKRFNLRPTEEFPDITNDYIERASWKKYLYVFHPHHIEKLIRKHFLGPTTFQCALRAAALNAGALAGTKSSWERRPLGKPE